MLIQDIFTIFAVSMSSSLSYKPVAPAGELDPVFARFGQRVWPYEKAEELRAENLRRKERNEEIFSLVPQKGMQEDILLKNADFLICGSIRGVGKTWVGEFAWLDYMDCPKAVGYGFRRSEDDIKRNLWESSKHVFTGYGTPLESYFEWKFPSGARFKMEQLYNPKDVRQRFRGGELPFMLVEELQEFTTQNMDLIFTLIGSNRNTLGLRNRFMATCNPVGKSNSLRTFLDWYIDPDTDTVIPGRDGKIRYFFRWGKTLKEIAWGDTKEEVYADIHARRKIDSVCAKTGDDPMTMITSLCFMQGDFKDNKILQTVDRNYIARLMAQGEDTSDKDVLGIWRDPDEDSQLLMSSRSVWDMLEREPVRRGGPRRASADVALDGDFMVIYAFEGDCLIDVEGKTGISSETVVPWIRAFLARNSVPEGRFTYDSNGLGLWLKGYFKNAVPFNNKARSSDPLLYTNKKTECAYKCAQKMRDGAYSIDNGLAMKTFVDKGGNRFTLRDRLLLERTALKFYVDDDGIMSIARKDEMKRLVGHSPDFIEGFFMVENINTDRKAYSRSGFGAYAG